MHNSINGLVRILLRTLRKWLLGITTSINDQHRDHSLLRLVEAEDL